MEKLQPHILFISTFVMSFSGFFGEHQWNNISLPNMITVGKTNGMKSRANSSVNACMHICKQMQTR